MPTYEYRCPNGHEFELIQRMSDEPEASCPNCGAQAERLLSAGAGFLFKGEGFYITDYRSEGYQKAAQAEQGKGSVKKGGKGSSGDKGDKAGSSDSTESAPKSSKPSGGDQSTSSKKTD